MMRELTDGTVQSGGKSKVFFEVFDSLRCVERPVKLRSLPVNEECQSVPILSLDRQGSHDKGCRDASASPMPPQEHLGRQFEAYGALK
jgi:hypothetical protein